MVTPSSTYTRKKVITGRRNRPGSQLGDHRLQKLLTAEGA
jgi:hypothetical protein